MHQYPNCLRMDFQVFYYSRTRSCADSVFACIFTIVNSLTIVLVIVLSIGFTQGLVFAVILWKNGKKDWIANRFKAMLLLVMSYGLLNQVLHLFGIGHFDTWYHLTLDLNWSYGPLLFLYVKAQSTQHLRLSKQERLSHKSEEKKPLMR